jgi:predicted negative regulator of RcsB-dependent stress response
MMAFFGWFVHYLIVFVVLVICAVLGVFCGKKWSEKKEAQKAEAAKSTEKTE